MSKPIKKLKAGLRNFTFEREADDELLRLKAVTGKNMTAVLEDLILGRRQFGEQVESFLNAEQDGEVAPRDRRAGHPDVLHQTQIQSSAAPWSQGSPHSQGLRP